jgi:two-component system sensor histidine kinase QseC
MKDEIVLKPSRQPSLQRRLLLWVLAAVLSVWATVAITSWFDARHELNELFDAHLAQSAGLLLVQQGAEFENDDFELPDMPLARRHEQRVAFQIWSHDRLVLKSSRAPRTPLSKRSHGFATTKIEGVRWRVFAASGDEAEHRILIGERVDARDEVLWAMTHNLLWPLAVALPVLGVLVILAVRAALRPLNDLSVSVAERRAESLESLPTENVPREVQPLVTELNALFGRVRAALENERRFTADAAHELRTPVAAIRAQAQVAMGATDDDVRRHGLQSTLDGCDRATHLIEQLLTLARFETSASAPPEPVDLDELARGITAELAPEAIAKQQRIEMNSAGPCRIKSQPALVGVLLRNLLDNAIRYSPNGASIRLTLRRDGEPSVQVEDSGPGLSADQQAKLGERFFRALGSGESGCGLGWSIVRRIAQAHRLKLSTGRSDELGGFQVTVKWPRDAAMSRPGLG